MPADPTTQRLGTGATAWLKRPLGRSISCVSGTLSLTSASAARSLGPAKPHLHEAALPPLEEARTFVSAAHDQNRAVAIHCVSEVELVFALALLEAAGAFPGAFAGSSWSASIPITSPHRRVVHPMKRPPG